MSVAGNAKVSMVSLLEDKSPTNYVRWIWDVFEFMEAVLPMGYPMGVMLRVTDKGKWFLTTNPEIKSELGPSSLSLKQYFKMQSLEIGKDSKRPVSVTSMEETMQNFCRDDWFKGEILHVFDNVVFTVTKYF